MRNLIVCCDGTWNTPEDKEGGVPVPTNVVRLYNALAETDREENQQLKYYHPGVGSEGNWWDKVAGGGMGIGLDKNVQSAYRWLADAYQPGDHVFVFGFSRGAFTVRSLAGMISECGLLDLTGLGDPEIWKRVASAYEIYRDPNENAAANWKASAAKGWAFHQGEAGGEQVPIHLVGVWDTVGALGIPDDMAILNLFDDPKRFAFHDVKLGPNVHHARHAVALDERRASFTPTLWLDSDDHPDLKQIWFPGVHSDVGGGYPETGLSDGALQWMIDEASALGLQFRDVSGQIKPDPWGVLHDSGTGVFRFLRTQPRSVPLVSADATAPHFHQLALDRRANPPISQGPYRPSATLAEGERKSLRIFARDPWNETGIYLEPGARYRFEASGEWLDGSIPSGPGGTSDGKFHIGEIVHMSASLWGKVESAFRKIPGQAQADLRGTKRVEEMPWFALVGVIANGGNPRNDGSPTPHETFLIGEGCDHPAEAGKGIEKSGYLYCFANDAWHFYGNNRGSVSLTVTRLS